MDATVRAKFRVHNVTHHGWGTEVALSPVYSDDPNSENKKFWDATPCGDLRMTIKNEAAAKHFVVGRDYYLDFTPAS